MQALPFRTVAQPLVMALALVAPCQAAWTGPYLGIEGLAVAADDRGREHAPDTGAYNGWKQDLNLDGYGAGLVAGYNWQAAPSWLLGVEIGYRRHDANDSVYQVFEADRSYCTPPSDCTISSKLDEAVSLTGRLGYAASESALIYALAGVTSAHLERVIQDWPGNGSTRYEYGKWQTGWTLGVGAEYLLGNRVSAKIEYRHSDLGSHEFSTPAYRGVVEKYDYRQQEISFGINYRF